MEGSNDLPFNEMIVHIKNAVNVNARGKIMKSTKKREALSSSTRTDPIA
jgi:hypothetical protein